MEVVQVPLHLLKPAPYNPRGMTDEEKAQLRQSIEEFGMVEPILANSNPNRSNIIIGGHQRFYILKELGWTTGPVVYIDIADEEKEKQLNLRLNRNLGHFDWELLKTFDREVLKLTGFSSDELAKLDSMKIDEMVEIQDVDISRLDVITVDGPGSPRLKNRKGFYFENMEQFEKVAQAFKTGTDYKLDGEKLLELISKWNIFPFLPGSAGLMPGPRP